MKTYKNPISTAMSEYREDFHYNKKWWAERMGTGNNNEYLWIQFKNGDNITVQSDYFQYNGNTCLPRFRADEVAYISRYYGDNVETTTAADIVVDTDRIILYRDGVEYFRCEMTEEESKEMRRQMWKLDDDTDSTTWMLDYCRAFATSKMNNNTTTTEPTTNTPSTMNANETTANHICESISRLRYELQQYRNNASKGGSERRRNMILLRWDIRKLERRLKAMEADKATKTVTVSVTDNGNRCEYTVDGKVLAAITYRKEFDAYDVNTPTVGYMTKDVTEAHKACESGITWLFEQSGRKAAFDYSDVEEYNAKHYDTATA